MNRRTLTLAVIFSLFLWLAIFHVLGLLYSLNH